MIVELFFLPKFPLWKIKIQWWIHWLHGRSGSIKLCFKNTTFQSKKILNDIFSSEFLKCMCSATGPIPLALNDKNIAAMSCAQLISHPINHHQYKTL